MFHYVYALESEKMEGYYVGYSTDLRRRLMEHNSGASRSTKPYVPWELVYYEACLNADDAQRREKYLETNQGARLLKARLKEFRYKRR